MSSIVPDPLEEAQQQIEEYKNTLKEHRKLFLEVSEIIGCEVMTEHDGLLPDTYDGFQQCKDCEYAENRWNGCADEKKYQLFKQVRKAGESL